MTALVWDDAGNRTFETGVDHGVLYPLNQTSHIYDTGVAWNGLTTVTESPGGAESNPQYADNIKYLNLLSAETFGATVEAYTYPSEFGACDGTAEPTPGVKVGQQNRQTFGLSYRTQVGNDQNSEAGYKLHLVYGCLAAPSEKAYATVNDSPEAVTFSWEISTTPVPVTGLKPTSLLVIDSTEVDAGALADLEALLYGTVGTDPSLPMPDDVIALFDGTVTQVTPTVPTFSSNTITIPTVTGVTYYINGESVTGAVPITVNTVVKARPNTGYKFPAVTDDDWLYIHT